MTEIRDRYRRRADAFEEKAAGVHQRQWDNQSPCADWAARDVVGHIVDMHAAMLRPLGRSLRPAPTFEEDPLAAFRAARADVEEVLDDLALATSDCDTPSGRMRVDEHIDRVVSEDLVLHGWDLAKATGQDATMEPADVTRALASMEAIPAETMEMFRTPGAFGPGVEVFGPEVKVGPDASPQGRLLGMIGRDPAWTPPAS